MERMSPKSAVPKRRTHPTQDASPEDQVARLCRKHALPPAWHGTATSPKKWRPKMNDTIHMLVLVVGAALATGALTFPITMPGARSGERPPVFLSFQTAAIERDPLADDRNDE